MPIATTCPNCKALFRLADELAGKKVQCQKCAAVFEVPQANEAVTTPGAPVEAPKSEAVEPTAIESPAVPHLPPPPIPFATESEPDEDDDPPAAKRTSASRRRPVREQSQGSGMMLPVLIGLGLTLVACIGCSGVGVVVALLAHRPAQPIQPDVQVQVQPKPLPVNFDANRRFEQDNALTQFDPLRFNKHHKIYTVRLEAKHTYEIDLISNQFDAYLCLIDENGLSVAEDDDGGGNQNALIIYTPQNNGVFQLVVTTFAPNEFGNYRLIVQRR